MVTAGMVIKAVVDFWKAGHKMIFMVPPVGKNSRKQPVNIEAVAVLAQINALMDGKLEIRAIPEKGVQILCF